MAEWVNLLGCCSVSAMKFLQENNVAHMDLKPQNILCTSRSDPVLKIAGKLLFASDDALILKNIMLQFAFN